MNKGYCIICGKIILPGEPTLWSKPKRGKTKYFHTECFNKIQQKFDDSPKQIETKQS